MDKNTKHIVASNLVKSYVILAKDSIIYNTDRVKPGAPSDNYLLERITKAYAYFLNHLGELEKKSSSNV